MDENYHQNTCKKVGLIQSKVDPYVFFKKNEKGQLLLACAVFVDDTIVFGTRKELNLLYIEVRILCNIELIGKLKEHLGIN